MSGVLNKYLAGRGSLFARNALSRFSKGRADISEEELQKRVKPLVNDKGEWTGKVRVSFVFSPFGPIGDLRSFC